MKAYEDPSEAWRNAPASVQDLMMPMANSFYQDNEQLQRDEAIRSTAFLAYAMMLTAKGMGYDSCPLIGFDPVEVSKIIGLPEGHLVSMLLTIGKGTKKPWEKPGHLNRARVLFENDFSNTPTNEALIKNDLKIETGTGFWSAVEDTFTPVDF